MASLEGPFLKRVYEASSATESRDIYDEWAPQYDKDLEAQDYAFPQLAAQAFLDAARGHSGSDGAGQFGNLLVLDAGCGTGLVGLELAKHGVKDIIGLDVSPKMLEIARRTGVYGSLEEADLSKPIEKRDDSVETIFCVGTLTRGHVGPKPALEEFVRIVKRGGLIVATVLDEVWESVGFKAEVERLRSAGKIEVLRSDEVGVRASSSTGAKLLVLRKE